MIKYNSHFGIKIPTSEKEAFQESCEQKGMNKSKVLRRLMEMFVKNQIKL